MISRKKAQNFIKMKTDTEIFALCDLIRETSFALHKFLRNGHLEKVYENGLAHRLRKANVRVEQQYPLKVMDEDGTMLGDFIADLIVEQSIVIELKACRQLCDEHIAQILGYLRACRMVHGLLINFGAPKFEIRKFALSSIES